jgi:hypothetical protein
MSRKLAPAMPHGPLVEVLPDVFVVTGTFRLDRFGLIAFPRNMTVLRRDGELTLVNSVRLTEAGERDLVALGKIRHLVRLGAFHGVDDPYYLARYQPTFWLPEGMPAPPAATGSPTRSLVNAARPEFAPDAEVFAFLNTRLSEAALRLPSGNGTLVVCDAIGNFETTAGFSRPMRWLTPRKSLRRCTVASAIWLRRMGHGRGADLHGNYQRLLALDFDALLPAHGEALLSGAKDALRASVLRMWPSEAHQMTP